MTPKENSRRTISALARKHAEKALNKLVQFMDSDDPKVASDAARHILDRAIGKPIAMSADVTDRLDELTEGQIDKALEDVLSRISALEGASNAFTGEENAGPTTH